MKPLITAIIIDDEKHARESLKSLVELYCPEVIVISSAENIQKGKTQIESLKPQIVFLDIDIGNDTAFDLLPTLNFKDFQLIFTTAYSEYALNAFQANAIDYLLKPIEPNLLIKAVEKAKKGIEHNSPSISNINQSLKNLKKNRLSISTSEGISLINIEEITHVEGRGNYSTFFLTSGEKIVASRGLKFFENLLPSGIFFRSHQSHIVNLNFIKSIMDGGSTINLSTGKLVPVSKSRKAFLMESLG